MAVIDNKGRLFGKVNLLDLIVLLGVLAVVGRFGYQAFFSQDVAPTGEDKQIEMTFKLPSVTQYTIDALQPGEDLYDSKSNTLLGKVVAVEAEPAVVVREVPDGLVERVSDTHFDYYVTVKGPARVSPNGITMSGIEMKVGRTNGYKTAYWAGSGTTVTFNLTPAAQ